MNFFDVKMIIRQSVLAGLALCELMLILAGCTSKITHNGKQDKNSSEESIAVLSSLSICSDRRIIERTDHAKKIAIEKHIKPAGHAMHGERSRHTCRADSRLWPVPDALTQELAHADLYYFESIMQPELTGTCGSRCVANALSISDIAEKGELNAKDVYTQSHTYDYLHTRDNLSNKLVAKLAHSMGLEHLHTFGFYEKDCLTGYKPKKNPFTCSGSTEYGYGVNLYKEEQIQQKIMETIRCATDIIVHFVCALSPIAEYDNGHWILISIIKQKDHTSKIIYMDSCNVPLDQEPQSQAYLSYLYWQCIA